MSTPLLYDVNKTYDQNCENGPIFSGDLPTRIVPQKRYNFFGFQVSSPLGIPAGPLLNSKWTKLAFETGADIAYYV